LDIVPDAGPESTSSTVSHRAEVQPRPIAWLVAAEIFAELPEFPWLFKGLQIAPGRPTLLSSFPDVGKTVIAYALALSVASGKPAFDVYTPTRTGPVLILDGEIGNYLARSRLQRLARGMGIDVSKLIEAGTLRLASYPDLRLDDEDVEARLTAATKDCVFGVIDSLRVFAGRLDEYKPEIGGALNTLARVSSATGTTFQVLHHNRKEGERQTKDAKQKISGNGAIPGNCESIFILSAEKNAPILVEHERTPIGTKLPNFGLRIEDVEKDGDPRWGLAVRHLEPEQLAQLDADASAKRTKAETNRAVSAVRSALERVGGTFKGSRADLRAASGIGATPFSRALAEMLSAGVIEKRGTHHKPEWVLLGGAA
jgi:hypothetical protein